MPTPQLKSLANKAGVPLATVERYWADAKQLASEMGKGANYNYITGIVKNRLGLDEEVSAQVLSQFLLRKFLESNIMDYKTFLEIMISTNLGVTPEKVMKDEEEDEEIPEPI